MICGLNCIKTSNQYLHIQQSDILAKNARVCFKYQYTFNRLIYRYNDGFKVFHIAQGKTENLFVPLNLFFPATRENMKTRMNSTGPLCRPGGHKTSYYFPKSLILLDCPFNLTVLLCDWSLNTVFCSSVSASRWTERTVTFLFSGR